MTYPIKEIINTLPSLDVHPANNTPPMVPEKFAALKLDILRHQNLYVPIWIRDGQLFDGKNRYKALQELKAEGKLTFTPLIEEWSYPDDDADGVFDSLNIHRNHFNSSQIAAHIAKYRLDQLKIEAEERMLRGKKLPMEEFPEGLTGTACQIAARLYGSNSKYIQIADQIKGKNSMWLDFVMSKQMSLTEANGFDRLKPDKAIYIFGKLKDGLKYQEAEAAYKENIEQQAEEISEMPNKKKTKDSQIPCVPTIIFTGPIDSDFADEITYLYSAKYGQATATSTVWDVTENEKLAVKINKISKFVANSQVAKGSGD